jgi:hypothetical protein
MLKAKDSLEDMANALKLSQETIVKYVEEVLKNKYVDIQYLLPSTKVQKEIKKAFKKHGRTKLKTNLSAM